MISLDVLIKPRPNGYTTGGLYLEDREGDCDANYCQITGKECAVFTDHGCENGKDCRECNVPIVAALCRVSRILGSKGVE
ncbi:MAG: hypothetical protein LUQ09_05065 [Methanomassiliicoccales archaeon]|nr:hypothetical protein [Methanomassiliicoccales archaeon]